MKATVGFLHAGEASRATTQALLVRKRMEGCAVHLVDPSLVDANAREFPIDQQRYHTILKRARELASEAERIVLSCSVYNGVAPWLQEDLGIPVDRSDAAAAVALLRTEGPVGVLVSFPPTRPVVVDYLSEVFAGAEQPREIRAAVTEDAPPFATSADVYRDALLQAMKPLADCGVLFLSQFSMHAHLHEIQAAWGERPLVSAVESTIEALRPS